MTIDITGRLEEHADVIQSLAGSIAEIEQIAERMTRCLRDGGKVCWMGNGGSAADSQHLAAELVGRFAHDRRPLASVALTTDTSALTAISNDYGFETVFARQVQAICTSKDLVFGLSTSGDSANIVLGLEQAKAIGVDTVALSGGDGGRVRAVADSCIVVASNVPARVQEAHILIGHILCEWAEVSLTGGNERVP